MIQNGIRHCTAEYDRLRIEQVLDHRDCLRQRRGGPIQPVHLVMLAETGILPRETAATIAGALKDIDATTDIATLTYTGEHEDYFFFVESELTHRLGPDVAGALHTARSRNDMDHTVFKLVLRGKADAFLAAASTLAETLIATARRERDTLIVAYTHGQPAQPSTFGHYLAAVADVLLRDIARLSAARDALDACPMGAAAITTSGFPVDRQRMADLLGFTAPTRNSYGSIAGVDYITGLYSAVRLTMLHLGRVVQDLQFWTAFEVGQLYVPNALVRSARSCRKSAIRCLSNTSGTLPAPRWGAARPRFRPCTTRPSAGLR